MRLLLAFLVQLVYLNFYLKIYFMKDYQLQKIFRLIGLAQRAGKLAPGRFAVTKSVKQAKAQLIIFSVDASEKLQKEISGLAAGVKIVHLSTKNELGSVLGRNELAVLAVSDKNFAVEIGRLINQYSSDDEPFRF